MPSLVLNGTESNLKILLLVFCSSKTILNVITQETVIALVIALEKNMDFNPIVTPKIKFKLLSDITITDSIRLHQLLYFLFSFVCFKFFHHL